MLDIKFIRENPEQVRAGVAAKQLDPSIVDTALELDKKWRTALAVVEELRKERNALAKERTQDAMSRGQEVKRELKRLEEDLVKITEEYDAALKAIPNLPAPDVKKGKDERENEVARTWGEPAKFDFEPKDHVALGEALGIIDIERAAKVSGTRFGYLKGDAVLLEFALVQYALEVLTEEGFTPVVPPVIIKKDSMAKMGYLEYGGENEMYVLERDNQVLVGTSEQALGPMHMDEVLEEGRLPLRYMGFSSCFRREAGAYGKDTRGIIRVHQFDKVEMFSFTKAEDSDKEHEFLLKIEEKLFQGLKIPYQVVKMCSGDIGLPFVRKYDLEAWMPGQNKYREVTSTSNATDYQARRLNIKYRAGGNIQFAHMLNGTAFAIGRTIVAILENFQQEDGSVIVPEVLRKWMGKDKIVAS